MQLTIIQYIILGIIQGITEWLPVSSSGMVTLVMSNIYGITNLDVLLRSALLLHLGTFFAALIYFRKEVWILTKSLFNYNQSKLQHRKIIKFLVLSTLISGVIGLIILKSLTNLNLDLTGKAITFFVGFFLLITGIIQIKINQRGLRKESDLKNSDSILLGFSQGLATLPGVSRSGITISTLMLNKFDDTTALRLSFLMSLPIVLFGNLLLNFQDLTFTSNAIFGVLTAFVFGLLTISGLMKLSKKINFGWFVLIFALVMMLSVLV